MPDRDGAGRVLRGLEWPLRVDDRGSIGLNVGAGNIEGAIRAIVATAPGDRLMHPDFGCRLWDLLARASSTAAGTELVEVVRESISRWEPHVDVLEVRVIDAPISAIHEVAGNHVGEVGVDVDVDVVERATGERFTVEMRCLLVPDGAHVVSDTGSPHRYVLQRVRGG
jgi:phage baseplate assembly protein W